MLKPNHNLCIYFQTYADEGHSFSGVQHHFYKAMESFLDDCFGPLDFEEWEIGTSFFTFKQQQVQGDQHM